MKTLKNPSLCALPQESNDSAGCPLHTSRVFFMEQWKVIKGFEKTYELSDHGRIKSYSRGKIKILKGGFDKDGYRMIVLCEDGKRKTTQIHLLVWDHFGDKPRDGHKLQVDHRDENKLNNHINNLQLLTNRENTTKYFKTQKTASKYTGVSWFAPQKIWKASIVINKKQKLIGYFNDEYEAHLAYQYELKKIESCV